MTAKSALRTFVAFLIACCAGYAEGALVPVSSLVAADGLEVSVWATTPMLHNPTNMDVDQLGRIWVAQAKNYRMFRNSGLFGPEAKGDAIVVLEDSNHDGKADKRHVFVQDPELAAPLGIAVIDNKVVVSQPPHLIVYEDVNRNAVFDKGVDKKEYLLSGFGGRDHDHSLHSVKTGPNGQWYFNAGNAGTHVVTDKEGWTLRVGSSYKGGSPSVSNPGPNQGGKPGLKSDDGHVYVGSVALRVNPDGTGLRVIGHNMRNSYEECVTSFGDVFQNDNDDPPACRTTWLMEYGNLGYASDDGQRKWQAERRSGQPAAIAEWRQEDPGTIPAGDVYGTGSPTGIAYYENGALRDQHRGLLLSCEALRNVVYGYYPKPTGAGFALERFDFLRSKTEAELGSSEKAEAATYFRPADVCVGPDGAVYVADWYDARVGGHRMSDPKAAGTIYRIAPKGKTTTPPKFDLEATAGQIEALKSPANNVRNLGFTRLKAQGAEAVPAVKALLADENPYVQARAVFLLAQMGPSGIAETEKVLQSAESAQMRIAAFRALRFVGHRLLAHAADAAKDPSPALRREVALALRDLPLQDVQSILLDLAKGYDGEDRWYLEAIGAACIGKEAEVYGLLERELGHADSLKWDKRFVGLAWRLHPPASVDGFKKRAMTRGFPFTARKNALTAIAYVPTEAAAMAMTELAECPDNGVADLAKFWLYNRSQHVWKPFETKMKGLNKKPNQLKADRDYKVPINGPVVSKLPSVQEVLALPGDASRGKTAIARCTMCHQIDGAGIDFGPALAGWGKGNSREVIATAIMQPSKDIAHGFEATRVVTKNGKTIEGFVMFAGGSYIMKVMGGGEVMIPRKRIKTNEPMDASLMLSAGQLGMSAQEVADVVEYLKVGDPDAVKAAGTGARPPQSAMQSGAREPSRASGDKKKILFIAGDTKHRHGFHEYKAGSILLADALNESGLAVEAKVHWYGWPEDESIFEGIDACIIYADGGGAFGEKYAFLDRKVEAGMGIMFMHYGVHPSKEVGEAYYKKWIGGYYDDAFSVNPSWIAELKAKPGHPVERGVDQPVRVFDELYWNLNFDESCKHCYPLATATPTKQNMVRYGSSKFWNKQAADKLGSEQALIWCRDPEAGARGAGFVGGHYHRNWAIDDYRKLVLNTIAWVAKLEVPKGGVPSKPVTKAMLNENLNRPDFPEAIELPTEDLLKQAPGKFPVLGPDGRMPPRKKRAPRKKK